MRTFALAVVVALVWAGSAAAAAGPSPRSARLSGRFQMSGRVTAASGIHGVHTGDRVTRIWTFTPTCAVGVCSSITLVRTRGHGSDTVTLKHKGPGYYSGTGSFYAPLQCGSRVYGHGWVVPFKITVHVTAASLLSGVVVATRVKATFFNGARKNETPCVVPPGHDSASYRGKLV